MIEINYHLQYPCPVCGEILQKPILYRSRDGRTLVSLLCVSKTSRFHEYHYRFNPATGKLDSLE